MKRTTFEVSSFLINCNVIFRPKKGRPHVYYKSTPLEDNIPDLGLSGNDLEREKRRLRAKKLTAADADE